MAQVVRSYIAVVKQPPGCYNVFRVTARGAKVRLKQSTGAECVAYAEGYRDGARDCFGTMEIRHFECNAGDAVELPWRGAL
jgi:hypothetical protein